VAESSYLIIGLGNKGRAYKDTRHNVGFNVVDAIAEKYKGVFQKKERLKGEVAQVAIDDKKVFLLKPSTYMNNSGQAVRATKDYYKIAICNLMVVADDIAIPFGEFRIKKDSGPGGHKGLESIESSLSSNRYPRLKVGIGDRTCGDLVSHVLGKWSSEEKKELLNLEQKAMDIIHLWLMQGIVVAMNLTNVRKKQMDKGVENEN
jgi:peptidyl-tRNA hydrolase, PTH1 family